MRKERPKKQKKNSRMEADYTGNPWTYFVVKCKGHRVTKCKNIAVFHK